MSCGLYKNFENFYIKCLNPVLETTDLKPKVGKIWCSIFGVCFPPESDLSNLKVRLCKLSTDRNSTSPSSGLGQEDQLQDSHPIMQDSSGINLAHTWETSSCEKWKGPGGSVCVPPARSPGEPYNLWILLTVSCSILNRGRSGRVYTSHSPCVCEVQLCSQYQQSWSYKTVMEEVHGYNC